MAERPKHRPKINIAKRKQVKNFLTLDLAMIFLNMTQKAWAKNRQV